MSTRVDLPINVWTLVISGQTEGVINLGNYPTDITKQVVYKIYEGSSVPTNDDDAISVRLKSGTELNKTITFNNSNATNVYIKAITQTGYAIV